MSESDNELDTKGRVDIAGLGEWEEEYGGTLTYPSLGLFIFFEVLNMGFFIFFYTVISFIPELLGITLNRYVWTFLVLEGFLHGFSWAFVIINYMRTENEDKNLFGGVGTITFIVYVILNVISIGFCIMYLIWVGIDTANIPAGYIRTWSIVILVVVFLLIIVIVLEVIFLAYYLRRWAFYFLYRNRYKAAMKTSFALKVAGEDKTYKWLKDTYSTAQIASLSKMGGQSDTKSFLPKKKYFWKKNNVKFDTKSTAWVV
jgi:hypothetical protein